MELKKYKFKIRDSHVDDMWKFADKNEVIIHWVKGKNINKWTFEGYMTAETYLLFRLSVPMDN